MTLSYPKHKETAKVDLLVKLNSNELSLPHSPEVTKAPFNYHVQRYPGDSCILLKENIAQLYGIDKGNILLTAGSSEAIALSIATFSDCAGEVVIPEPAFIFYGLCAKKHKRHVSSVAETDGWQQNLDRTLDVVPPHTQLIFLTNPSNPIGTWIKKNKLEIFLEKLPRTVKVVIDEAYAEFMEDEPGYFSGIGYLDAFPNVIVTRTFSKLYGLAGARIGYAVSNANTIEELRQYQPPFSVNSLAVEYAQKVLEVRDYYNECKKQLVKTRHFLFDQLSQMGMQPLANSANFLTFSCGPQAKNIIAQLEKQNILVGGLGEYHLPEFIRVSIGTENEIQRFLECFSRLIGCEVV